MSIPIDSCQETGEGHNEIGLVIDSSTDGPKCCPGCTLKVTVTSIDDIKKGDHICYRPSWYSPYRHHAIVENVDRETEKLDLIHFTRRDGNVSRSFSKQKFKIQKTSIRVGETNSLKVVKYPGKARIAPDETIKIATEEMNKEEVVKYNICNYNCEHLCYQSTIGNKNSKQVESCLRKCGLSSLSCGFILAWLVRYFAKFIIIPIIDIAPRLAEIIAITLFVIVSISFFLYCILRSSSCCKNHKACKGCFPERCDRCTKRHNYIRWIRFSSFLSLQVSSLIFEIHFIRQGHRHEAVLLTGLAFLFVTLFTISKVPNAVRFCLTKGNKFSSISNV
ncbi:uncharacterized protein LOC132716912 isoform X2 [Ruditapes philippinarum]|uniref:uncharacterized protein LOC132716912 isoform X2 n=1 Tax=Ruditapes philippinarum TaxID=129788 RepID=UPI00295AD8A1|nr:uncharacterized protein LOC132716912 isoform X2 [Ruditapes philippinarum]